MTLVELLPEIESLPRADKLRLIQVLAADVAREEELVNTFAEQDVPIWSQFDAIEGASTLLQVLNESRKPT